jgi:hypothetical protein
VTCRQLRCGARVVPRVHSEYAFGRNGSAAQRFSASRNTPPTGTHDTTRHTTAEHRRAQSRVSTHGGTPHGSRHGRRTRHETRRGRSRSAGSEASKRRPARSGRVLFIIALPLVAWPWTVRNGYSDVDVRYSNGTLYLPRDRNLQKCRQRLVLPAVAVGTWQEADQRGLGRATLIASTCYCIG